MTTIEESSPFDWQPTLIGKRISLRPLRAEDFAALYAAASDPLIWEQHPDPQRYRREVFEQGYFAGALQSGGALVVTENPTEEIIGSSWFYDWNAAEREVAIGYTFLVRRHWGGATNGEMKRLMLNHAFRRAHRVWFHIGQDNRRSRRAIAKIGAVLSHTEPRAVNGVPHDYCYYRIDAPTPA